KRSWSPDVDGTDRWGSCQLAAADVAAPLANAPLYAAHPPLLHSPRQLGCTLCHGGQGRATTAKAAHGDVEHWDEPLLPRGYEEAGCGSCHSGLKVGSPALIKKGQSVVAEVKCVTCHHDSAAPDLATIGLHGFRADWHAKH